MARKKDTNSKIFSSNIRNKYITACMKMKKYFFYESIPPHDIDEEYQHCLKDYRNYLDSLKVKMPQQIHPYNSNDKTTWKYLSTQIGGSGRKKIFIKSISNPDYKYQKRNSYHG